MLTVVLRLASSLGPSVAGGSALLPAACAGGSDDEDSFFAISAWPHGMRGVAFVFVN